MPIGSSDAGRGKLILPPLRRTEADAFKFARAVHTGQTDKAGKPYLGHLDRVHTRLVSLSAGCPFWDVSEVDEAEQIAWLHDVIEDIPDGENRLRNEAFPDAVIRAVSWLSRNRACNPTAPYEDWVMDIASYAPLAILLVKLADVEDNSDPERLALLPEETRARLLRKYEPAKEVLRAAARQKGWQG